MVKNLPASEGDMGSIPGSGRAPGEGMATPPVFLPGESCGQRSLAVTVHGVAKSQTQLRSKHFHFPDTNTGTIQVLGEVVCDEGLVSGAPQGAPQELAGGRTHRGSDGRGRDV